MKESETTELKKSLAELNAGLVSISAILNKHGRGELWFGIRNDGNAVGVDAKEKTLRDVSQAIAAHIEPKIYPHVTLETIDDRPCIKVAFEGHETPYFSHGRAYMRVADEDRQLSAKELEKLILDPDYVQVAIFKNRAEIRNPGNLYGSLTLADLRKGHVSQRRNPLIADLFRRIEMVEAWGRGMPLILKNAPDVVFREIGSLFIVSFNRPSYEEKSSSGVSGRSGKAVPKRKFGKGGSVKKFGKGGSVKTGQKILDLLSNQREMTIPELAMALHLTSRAVEKQIVQLRNAKLLLRTGGRKLGRWEVLK